MAFAGVLKDADIAAALEACKAPDSFNPRKFFQLCGLTKKSPQEVKNVFNILDNDASGFIEEEELKFFLQRFSAGARVLTDKETKAFLSAADDDSDGKIGVDGNCGFYIIFPSFIIKQNNNAVGPESFVIVSI
uniref:Parvalbumin n=1 Tax=Cyprinus carpio TaxID=7962 RepID=A0A8C2I085_CYPCA